MPASHIQDDPTTVVDLFGAVLQLFAGLGVLDEVIIAGVVVGVVTLLTRPRSRR